MENNNLEIYQLSIYCDTVYTILKQHRDLSIVKLIFFSYVINKERFFNRCVYNSKHTTDILSKEISTINGDFVGYANITPYIIKAIHVLTQAKKIKIEGNIAHLMDDEYKCVNRNEESKFVFNVIEKSKSWSDKRFMREVLHNV